MENYYDLPASVGKVKEEAKMCIRFEMENKFLNLK